MPEKLTRSVNQVLLGIGIAVLLALLIDPRLAGRASVESILKLNSTSEGAAVVVAVLLGPLLALGMVVESGAGTLMRVVSRQRGHRAKFPHAGAALNSAGSRAPTSYVLRDASEQAFAWTTEHHLRAMFAASWGVLFGLAVLPVACAGILQIIEWWAVSALTVTTLGLSVALLAHALEQLERFERHIDAWSRVATPTGVSDAKAVPPAEVRPPDSRAADPGVGVPSRPS